MSYVEFYKGDSESTVIYMYIGGLMRINLPHFLKGVMLLHV